MRLVVVAAVLMLVPVAASQTLRAGEDPAGDSNNQIVPGGGVGAAISNDRTDIRYLDFEDDGDRILVRLGLTTLPAGTSGYMYRAVFDVGATRYYTCYAVQWTGGDASLTQENVLGCSRFTSNTNVGPATRAAGVIVADNAITWPVAKSAIGGGGLESLTGAFADTWFRGVSTCCPGSTTQTQYLWNQADRGPDADTWAITYAAPAPVATGPAINITSDVNRTAAPPGGHARFVLNLTASVAVNATLHVDGLDWNVTGLSDVALGNGSVTQELVLGLPADANGTYIFEVQALVDGNVTGRLELIVDADPNAVGYVPPAPSQGAPRDQGNATTDDTETPTDKDTPVPFWVPALAVTVVAARRRRSQA